MCLMVLACYWPFQREPGIDDVQMGLREAERRGGVGGRDERLSGGPAVVRTGVTAAEALPARCAGQVSPAPSASLLLGQHLEHSGRNS